MAQAARADGSGLVTRRGPRRRHSIAQKLAIISECLQAGASLAGVALAHQVNANMVRKWVVKYQRGGYGEFAEGAMLPVVVKSQPVIRASRTKPGTTATVEVELRRGVLRIHDADAALLNALVVALSA